MAINAREQAKKTGDSIGTKCQGQIHVNQGDGFPDARAAMTRSKSDAENPPGALAE
jgi:hypothetical protein